MAGKQLIPDKINRFNVYVDTVDAANKLVGVSSEIQLPTFESLSETLYFAGSGGEIESPTVGQYKSAELEISFTNISRAAMELAADDSKMIILRGRQEFIDPETHKKTFKTRVISVRGMTKKIDYGKLKMSGNGEPSLTKEVTMYKDELDGETITEINKLGGGRMIIGGRDITEELEG